MFLNGHCPDRSDPPTPRGATKSNAYYGIKFQLEMMMKMVMIMVIILMLDDDNVQKSSTTMIL